MRKPTLGIIALLVSFCGFSQELKNPSFEEIISLKSAGNPEMSADGANVAFTVRSADWGNNKFKSEIWISKNGKPAFQLTQSGDESSSSPRFSPDGNWMAFISERHGKGQIFLIRVDGGEAFAITNEKESIADLAWSPSGREIFFIKAEPEDKKKKESEKRYGGFEIDDREFTLSHLWKIRLHDNWRDPSELPCYQTADSLKSKSGCITLPTPERQTNGAFTVTSFEVSPDGSKVAFNHQPNPLINSFLRSDISLLDVATGKVSSLVANGSTDALATWSPDGKEILYTTNENDSISNFYVNSKLFAIDIQTGKSRRLAEKLDEDLGGQFVWNQSGIYTTQWHKTKRPIYKIDPRNGSYSVFLDSPDQIFGIAFSKSGDRIAVNAKADDQLNDIFISVTKSPKLQTVSAMNRQLDGWATAQSEVVSWKSKDGATIEGVLHKPGNYDPSKKYPLLVVIHGGPTGIDFPTPAPNAVYPILQWLNKGCLVLRPNYRGSAGYGEKFRSLNVENLGVGDAWDVLSGVDYLDSRGLIDKSKMGCMGWSQGGYISAFLTTTSDVFKAISVGAGISDWSTYYVNTDIHPFTRQYLKSTPWSNPEIYRKTSPISYINQAKTPTLIQHGEFDRRVPIPNAYELLQGLRDHNVPSELIVYKGFGHGITKPKERLAATWHNWQWFNKYIWNEEIELPLTESTEKK